MAFRPKREEAMQQRRLQDKSIRMKWVGHVADMADRR
jgi:hypothetical protein